MNTRILTWELIKKMDENSEHFEEKIYLFKFFSFAYCLLIQSFDEKIF